MKTINLAEQKLLLFQKILTIQNEKKINQLFSIVDILAQNKEEDTKISFKEWNNLFMKEQDLNEFIPEYNMTLGEYRKKIYNIEISNDFPINQFI